MHSHQWSADPRVPGIGLGFFETSLAGEPALFHTGARIHFSLLCLFPGRKVGLFVVHAMRQGGEFQTLRADFARAFAARYFPHVSPPSPQDDGAAARATALTGVYRPHLLPTTTIERAAGLFSDTRVRIGPDGRLRVEVPAAPPLTLTEIDAGLYRVMEGPEEGLTFAFQRDERGRVRGMSMSGSTADPVTFERLAWFRRGALHAVLLGLVFLLFAACAVAAPVASVVRRIRRRPATGPAAPRRTWWTAVGAGWLVLASPLSIAALVLQTGDDTAADGLRFALRVGCTFLLAGAAAALALVPLSVMVWRKAFWSTPRRVWFYALAAAATVAVPLLLHYHLPRYWF